MASKKQAGLWDREVENAELLAAAQTLSDAETIAYHKAFEAAKKTEKSILESLDLKAGERLRCGEFVWTGRLIEREDNTIPAFRVVSGKRKRMD